MSEKPSDIFYHFTNRVNVPSIRQNGLTVVNRTTNSDPLLDVYGDHRPVYVATSESYGGKRIKFAYGDEVVGLEIQTAGHKLLPDIPGLVTDYGVVLDPDNNLLLDSGLSRHLFQAFSKNGVITPEQYMNPDSDFSKQAIKITGTAAIQGGIDQKDIALPSKFETLSIHLKQLFKTNDHETDQPNFASYEESEEYFTRHNPYPVDNFTAENGGNSWALDLCHGERERLFKGDLSDMPTIRNVKGIDITTFIEQVRDDLNHHRLDTSKFDHAIDEVQHSREALLKNIPDGDSPKLQQLFDATVSTLEKIDIDPNSYSFRHIQNGETVRGHIVAIGDGSSTIVQNNEMIFVDNADLPARTDGVVSVEAKAYLSQTNINERSAAQEHYQEHLADGIDR